MTNPSEDRSRTDFPRDEEEARLDLELTRQELGETVQELAHKANVPARAREQAEHTVTAVKEKLPPPVAEKAETVAGAARRNPVPTVVGAVVLLLLVRRLTRRRKR
ncbi:Protein of unknown function [Amycolatopsis arida]|uniref:DUF3618 domain-containing protein n=1 Tax=Amycolatopsis arida TaxID=587909 RepID=A0A1I5XHF2_9PSEU|nr:DUF3618 domain-containing protein [Amycolatopsis arida]TDX97449.1 uncharacterized protein DUF3618 [Amycolatopsis arida]SFQ31392.1 Protein of unknown function [Amycolatopsis arida]